MSKSSALVIINGQLTQDISVFNRALAYGDGVFETIKVIDGVPVFFARHLARLQHGCEQLAINLDIDRLMSALNLLWRHNRQSGDIQVLKMVVSRGYCGPGYQIRSGKACDIMLTLTPYQPLAHHSEQGVAVAVADHRLPLNPALAGIKHLNRLDHVLAGKISPAMTHTDYLLQDSYGFIVEGVSWNVFVVKGQSVTTPQIHRCGVAGIVREWVLERVAADPALTIEQADLKIADLIAADELFLCNSLRGICPIIAIGCHRKPAGKVTSMLQRLLHEHERHDVEINRRA